MNKEETQDKLIEAIEGFQIRKKVLSDSIKRYAYHFPKLHKSYLNRIDTIDRCIKRIENKYNEV